MTSHHRILLLDREHSSDFLAHPDYFVVASFFVGLLFMSSIQYILYSPITGFVWRSTIQYLKVLTGRRRVSAYSVSDANSVSEKISSVSSVFSEGDLALKRVPTLTLTLFCLIAMAGIANFVSLLTFSENEEALCAFEVAWSSMSIQSARIIGLTIIGFSLRSLRITRWESWTFALFLLALTGMSLVTVVLGRGVLRPIETPDETEIFSCYRQHNFHVSLATSVLAMVIEGYCVFRSMSLLTPNSTQLLHSIRIARDTRVVRGFSLFALDANMLLASSGAAGFYGEFIPIVTAGIIVMAAFNATVDGRRYLHDRSRSDSPPLLDVGQRGNSMEAIMVIEIAAPSGTKSPFDGPISSRTQRIAPASRDIEDQYIPNSKFDYPTTVPRAALGPRVPPPARTTERRLSQVSTTVTRSVGALARAASTFISRPIIPKATLVQKFEEQLQGNTTEFISASNDPRTRYSYVPPSVVSRSGSNLDSDDGRSTHPPVRRATVAGGSTQGASLSRAPTGTLSRKASAAFSVVTVSTQSDHGTRRGARSMRRHNTFGYRDTNRNSYASTARRTSIATTREGIKTAVPPRPSNESLTPASDVSRSTSAASSSMHAVNSHATTPEPPELPIRLGLRALAGGPRPRPPPGLSQRTQSGDTSGAATTSTSARDGDVSVVISPADTPEPNEQEPAQDSGTGATMTTTTLNRVASALSRTGIGQRVSRMTTSSFSVELDPPEVGTSANTAHSPVSRRVQGPRFIRRTRIGQVAPSSFAQAKYVHLGGGGNEIAVGDDDTRPQTVTMSSGRASFIGPIPALDGDYEFSNTGTNADLTRSLSTMSNVGNRGKSTG